MSGDKGLTPLRVVGMLCVPAATITALAGWWLLDTAAYAYRLHRSLKHAVG